MQLNLTLIVPEIAAAAAGLLVLILSLISGKESRKGLGWVALFMLAGIAVLVASSWSNQGSLYGGLYMVDRYTQFFKLIFLAAAFMVVLGSMGYVDKNLGSQGEYYSLVLFAVLGMMIMTSAGDLMTLYLGLELMTIAFVVLVCFRRTGAKSLESGIKYVLLASISSAVLLFGMSLVYGVTGTVIIADIGKALTGNQQAMPLLISGVVLLVAGLGFKISLVPFHMWAPDIYEGAPTPIAAFLAVGSKAASFAILIRLFLAGMPGTVLNWPLLLAILAAVTIIVGNLVAIPQTNIKRMLAYSSIAQAGYILVGVLSATPEGIKAVLFYGFIYIFATVAAFTVASHFYNITGSDEIKDYAGLAQRSPLMAVVMIIAMLSMAGIPPLAGFVGKFYLFMTIVDQYLWLVIIGLIMSMVSVYYYLRVALVMYRDEPADGAPVVIGAPVAVTLLTAMIVTLLLGIYPGPLSSLLNTAAATFFH